MPGSDCVHKVDFDKFEYVNLKQHRHRIQVSCQKCGTGVTLGDVLESLTRKVYNLNNRLLEMEKLHPDKPKEESHVEPVAGADS